MTEEMLPQNKRPINQAAKTAMQSLNFPSSPTRLYALQLAIAAMEDGIAGGQGNQTDDQILLEHLERWSREEKPKTIMDRLMEPGGLDDPAILKLPPEELAAEIVGEFSSLLMNLHSGYGMGRTPPGYRTA